MGRIALSSLPWCQNSNIILQLSMLTNSQVFEVRSTESYQLSESSGGDSRVSHSLESVVLENEEVSDTIKELILQEKRKNFISRTEQFYQTDNLRRCHSASLVHRKKENLTLPSQIERLLLSHRKCPNIASDDLLDSIYGAFFGFVIGDVVGAHIAYKLNSIYEIPSALLMNGGGTYNIGPGQGTDQTEIMLSTCYGLIDAGNVYNSDFMARRYLRWLQSKPFNISAIYVLSLVEIKRKKQQEKGITLEGLGEMHRKNSQKNKNHESNLGLIRIIPLVVWSLNLAERQFHKLIRDELSLICPNELVIETGIIYGMMLRIIVKTKDHELAFYEASKWVYSRGSEKLKDLWRHVELDIEISSKNNIGKLKTSFTYACIEINKRQVKFMESLLNTLVKGGDTDANCAIVMGLVGSIVGYNMIPSYFKQKIVNSRMSQSSRPREDEYTPYHIVEIVQNLLKNRPEHYVKQSSTLASSTII